MSLKKQKRQTNQEQSITRALREDISMKQDNML